MQNFPKVLLGIPVAALLLGGSACYPNGASNVTDYDTVLTVRDETFDFGGVSSFVVVDTVLDLSDEAENPVELTDEYDDLILAQLRSNFRSLGWQEVANDPGAPAPDVVVLVGKLGQENSSAGVWWPGYPGWGWGWYPPCFGCGPVYPPVVSVYTWNTGTVLFTLFDGSSVGDGDGEIDATWIGGLNGVLSESANASSRITRGIDQAFAQSPYLGGN